MAVLSFYTSRYANDIYIQNLNRFTARDGFPGIADEYHVPVMQYAANNFTKSVIDNALAKGYINQAEYDETCTYLPVTPVTYSPTVPTN